MKKIKKNKTSIGGQAVLEGVMMRGERSMATAVRDADGVIRLETKRLKPNSEKPLIARLPLVRGAINFFSSLVVGTQTLMRSASVYGEEEPTRFEKWLSEKMKINVYDAITFLGVAIGLALSVGLFIVLPQFLTGLLSGFLKIDSSSLAYNLIEGGLRTCVFVFYILLTSLLKDIRRTYMYHGAEHKTITCYERGMDLTVENVKKCPRVHDRCGTTFMFLVMIISILVFAAANAFLSGRGFTVTGVLRVLVKIALLPVVAGISYEVLRLLAKSDFFLLYIFKAPGLLLQLLTTKEPDDGMIEVAITSFNAALEMDADANKKEQRFVTATACNKLLDEVKGLLKKNGVTEEADAEWLVAYYTGKKRSELKGSADILSPSVVEKILAAADERAQGKPLCYVLGTAAFYGRDFVVTESTLIPRPETEELVYHALRDVNSDSDVLDLCTGSGAIAVTVALEKGCSVTGSDVSAEALAVAEENAKTLGTNVKFVESDLFEKLDEKYDVIISNPPYITAADMLTLQEEVKREPRLALYGGEDGLDFYRRIAEAAPAALKDGGKLYLECGYDQSEAITRLLSSSFNTEVIKDVNGIDRIVKGVKK